MYALLFSHRFDHVHRYLLIECEQQTADQCTAWGAGRAEADGDADGEGGGGMGR